MAQKPPQTGRKRSVIDVPGKLNELSRRMRSLEEGLKTLEERTEHFKQDSFNRISKLEEKEGHTSKGAAVALHDSGVLKDEVKKIRKDMAKLAPLAKVNELDGYLNIIDPMNMMTRTEVMRMIKEGTEHGDT